MQNGQETSSPMARRSPLPRGRSSTSPEPDDPWYFVNGVRMTLVTRLLVTTRLTFCVARPSKSKIVELNFFRKRPFPGHEKSSGNDGKKSNQAGVAAQRRPPLSVIFLDSIEPILVRRLLV